MATTLKLPSFALDSITSFLSIQIRACVVIETKSRTTDFIEIPSRVEFGLICTQRNQLLGIRARSSRRC